MRRSDYLIQAPVVEGRTRKQDPGAIGATGPGAIKGSFEATPPPLPAAAVVALSPGAARKIARLKTSRAITTTTRFLLRVIVSLFIEWRDHL
jgi:hypothetical protein